MPILADPQKYAKIAATLVVGTIGGTTAYLMNMPLPWMLGPMVLVFALVMLKVPLDSPGKLRPYVFPVIGVMLGSGFDTETFGHLARWGLSLAGLGLYLTVAAALVVPFYIKVGKLDPITAFFSAMPGGLNEMTIIGGAMGGDEKRIILAHGGRILVSIALIAFWFRIVLGYEVTGVSPAGTGDSLSLTAAAILLACAVIGTWIGDKLKLPAPGLLGPLVLSAAVHMLGITHSQPPALLVITAQIILGSTLGSRFRGAAGKLVLHTLLLTFGGTVITLALLLVFALVFHGLFAQTVEQVLLAYAPGGLTEMSLVALAMNAEVAYISIHHLVRIVLIIAIAPTILPKIASRLGY